MADSGDVDALRRQLDETRARLVASEAEAARYRNLFENMGQGYCELELIRDAGGVAVDQRYLAFNPAFERLFGIAVADAVGRTASEVFPQLEHWWHQAFDHVARSGQPERLEYSVAALSRRFEVFAYPAGGDRLTVLYEDVSDRRRAEDELVASEERQAFLLRFSDALRTDETANAVANHAIRMLADKIGLDRCYITYYRPDEDAADFPYQLGNSTVPPLPATVRLSDFPDAYEQVLTRTFILEDDFERRGLSQEERANSKALGMRAMLASTIRKGENRPLSSMVAVSSTPRRWSLAEIALVEEVAERTWAALERARSETALRESEERLRGFGEASADILWIRDAKTMHWTYLTPAFERIYGLSRDEALSGNDLRRWAELIVPEDRETALDAIRRVREGAQVQFEYRIRRLADGAVRWLRNTDFPIRNDGGEVVAIGGIGHDVTAEKEAASRLNVLFAELQHRTRNLVAVVRAMSDRTAEGSDDLPDYLARFQARLGALARINRLLSKLDNGERVTFDRMLRTELEARGFTDDDPSTGVVLDGPTGVRLRSATVQTFALAIHELATNAVKYGALSNGSGRLTVTWRVRPDERGLDRLHVEWIETGVSGMPEVGAAPRGGGYGRMLIEQALPYQLDAATTYELRSDGVRCTIDLPLQ